MNWGIPLSAGFDCESIRPFVVPNRQAIELLPHDAPLRHRSIHEHLADHAETLKRSGLFFRRDEKGSFGEESGSEACRSKSRQRVGVESLCRVAEIARTDDVVALEHRSCSVAGQLHGHALGYAGSYEVANRRSSQVVRNPARARGRDARPIVRASSTQQGSDVYRARHRSWGLGRATSIERG